MFCESHLRSIISVIALIVIAFSIFSMKNLNQAEGKCPLYIKLTLLRIFHFSQKTIFSDKYSDNISICNILLQLLESQQAKSARYIKLVV
jgi:hypothetical protein